jgi:hypothetical protein
MNKHKQTLFDAKEDRMFRSTALLIEARTQYCKHPPMVVPVQRKPTGQANDCINNAEAFRQANPGALLVSGWLAHEFDDTNTADFIQHWWNFHDGYHVDTTPMSGVTTAQYVLDTGLYEFAQANYDSLRTLVASSLLLKGRRFEIVTHVDGIWVKSKPIAHLVDTALYHASRV